MNVGFVEGEARSGNDFRTRRVWFRRPMGRGPDTDQMRGYAGRLRVLGGVWEVRITDMREFGTPDVVIRRLLAAAESLLPEGSDEPGIHEAREFLVRFRQRGAARSRWYAWGSRLAQLGPGHVIRALCETLDRLRGRPPLVPSVADRLSAALDEGGLTVELVDEAVAALRALHGALAGATASLDEAGRLLGALARPDTELRETVLAVRAAAERGRAAIAVSGPRRTAPAPAARDARDGGDGGLSPQPAPEIAADG